MNVSTENRKDKKELKILIIGDCQVGKTSLLLKFGNCEGFNSLKSLQNEKQSSELNQLHHSHNKQNQPQPGNSFSCVHGNLDTAKLNLTGQLGEYVPTSLLVSKCDLKINSTDYRLCITDISGCRHNEKLVQLRKFTFSVTKDIDAIIMCFSLVDPVSFSNVSKKWFPEIRQYYKYAPILLVGTKSDIKHQLKYQRKNPNFLKQSASIEDLTTANTTFQADTTISLLDVKRAAARSPSTSHRQYKCSYCSNLDVKRRTSRQRRRRTSEAQTKSFSIVSKVSHKHIESAEVLIDENNNNNIDKLKLDFSPVPQSFRNLISFTETKAEEKIQTLIDEIPKLNLNEKQKNEANEDEDYDEVCSECDQCNCDDCCCCYSHESDVECESMQRRMKNYDSYLSIAGEVNTQTQAATSLLNDSIFNNNKFDAKLNESNPRVNKVNIKSDEVNAASSNNVTQIDINTVYKTQLIKRSDCVELRDLIKARKYLQCSCLDEVSIKNVMENAIKLALDYQSQRVKLEEKNVKKRRDFSLFRSKRNKINDEKVDLSNKLNDDESESEFEKIIKKEEEKFKTQKSSVLRLVDSPTTSTSSPKTNKKISRNKSIRCLSCTRSETNNSLNNV